jgi:hypothetical protein
VNSAPELKNIADGRIEPRWLDEKARAWNLDSVKISTPIKANSQRFQPVFQLRVLFI